MFEEKTIDVARRLLGCHLIHGSCVGKIVETEAYLCDDPACHASRGMTKRNAPMFGPAGTAYVYFTYGMHYCFNVVTNIEGVGEAVLIRAVEPLEGIELMQKRRNKQDNKQLCSGPAKLVQAFGITMDQNGHDLSQGDFRIEFKSSDHDVQVSSRIGISQGTHLPYRFCIKGSNFLSR
jgi:DNA-3-methyladenine glycosylase